MKKLTPVGVVLTIAMLLVLPGSVGAKDELAEGIPMAAGASGFMFAGYCDGATLSFDAATGITTGVYGSRCATCPFSDAMGGTIGIVLGGQGVAFPMAYETVNDGLPPWYYSVIRVNRTWTHYYSDGSVLNQGTWTPCGPGVEAPAGAGLSTAP